MTPGRRLFDSQPTLLRRLDDSGTSALPVADAAAGAARPGLDAGVHRLRVERIAIVVMGEPDARGAAPRHARDMGQPVRPRRPDGTDWNLLWLDLELVARPSRLAATITLGLDRDGGEMG